MKHLSVVGITAGIFNCSGETVAKRKNCDSVPIMPGIGVVMMTWQGQSLLL
jgi:hypothetical protein